MSVVARVEAWPVNVPLEATYLMAPGVYPGMSRTVVRVTTSDGVVGLGETPSPDDAALLAGELGASFAGRDCTELRESLGSAAGPVAASPLRPRGRHTERRGRSRAGALGHRGARGRRATLLAPR